MNKHPDTVMMRQVNAEQIIRDETWLEGERRGQPVAADDPAVRENVCRVILYIGAELRKRCSEQAPAEFGAAT